MIQFGIAEEIDMLIKKIKKYLGKINFIEDVTRESKEKLNHLEDDSRK